MAHTKKMPASKCKRRELPRSDIKPLMWMTSLEISSHSILSYIIFAFLLSQGPGVWGALSCCWWESQGAERLSLVCLLGWP